MKSFPFSKLGLILLSWGALNTSIDIYRYGLSWGSYWWFCNLALIGMGIGLLLKNRDLLVGFLSIASFTQVFWLFDNAYHQIRGKSFFGLVDFMYRPGYPVDEFFLSHYHYFTIPIAFAAILYLPRKRNLSWLYIAICNPLIFGISYFCFSAEENVNCIHQACFPGLTTWQGPVYAFSFWLVIFSVHLIMSFGYDRLFQFLSENFDLRTLALRGFGLCVVVGLSFAMHDTFYKLQLPSFHCETATFANELKMGCVMTRAHHDGSFLLTYYAKNLGQSAQSCIVRAKMNDELKEINPGLFVNQGEQVTYNIMLNSPSKNTTLEWQAECRHYETVAALNP